MKSLITLLTFHLFFFSPLLVRAYDVEVDGICYGLIGNRKAFVTHPGDWSGDDEQWTKTYRGEIVIPEQITYKGHTYTVMSVGENAFAGQDNLTSVRLPSSVRGISACAFLGCTSLRQVTLSATMLGFGSCAFTGCTSLQQISLPRHAELVDSLTFYCCASLTRLVLPHRIRTVCQGALEHIPALNDLYCFATNPPFAEPGAFTPADQQHCILHVPAKALALYQESPVWRDFCGIVALSDEDYLGQGYRRGDINDDGRVDADDLALLRRLIVCLPDDKSIRWAADVNSDGIVNAVDFVKLAGELRVSKM